MAARENQGLQIALIIFVMLTIVLIVTTYLFFSKFQEEREKSKALTAENSKATTVAAAARDESDAYKTTIGAESKDNKDSIAARTKKDFDTHGKSIPEANQNYRYLVEQLGSELKNANTRITELTASEAELTAKIKLDEADKVKEMEKYTATVATTADELVKRSKDFDKARGEITSGEAKLKDKFDSKRKEFEDLTKKSNADVARLSEESVKLTKRLQDKYEEEQRGQRANELPDGKIVKVDQRARTAWINRGSADGLRRQTSFSVFDADDSNPLEGSRKGKIEVVRLVADHMAEARIVDDDLSNPLMQGDPIFSPTWEPGRTEHFALAGRMDIDKDGKSDLQRVRDLIVVNGGIIDEEVGDDDQKTGQMSINTKYLVLGEPTIVEGKTKNYSDAQSEAQLLGVKTIKLDEFLNYLGYKAEDRTVNLGKGAQARDFKPRLPNDTQRIRPTSPSRDLRKPISTKKAAQ